MKHLKGSIEKLLCLFMLLFAILFPQTVSAKQDINSLLSDFQSAVEITGSEQTAMVYARSKKYNSSSWNALGGQISETQSQKLKNNKLNRYTSIKINGQAFDVPHFFAALSVYGENGRNPLLMPCIHMCGWAGDLAAYAEGVDKTTFLGKNSLFFVEDWTADLDAWNIYEIKKSTGKLYAAVMTEYFSDVTETSRVEAFQQKISTEQPCNTTKESFTADLKEAFQKQYKAYAVLSKALSLNVGIPQNLKEEKIEKACQNITDYIWTVLPEGPSHNWDSGVISKAATYSKTGIQVYTCQACGSKKEVTLPKKVIKNGDKVYDANKKAQYQVTDAGKKEAAYLVPVNKKTTQITIPASVKLGGITFNVVKIANSAFKNNKYITEVTLGSNIRSVGNHAFYGASNLKKITLNKNLEEIGSSAFRSCTSLKTLSFPAKMTKVGINAFLGDKNLKTLKFVSTALKSTTLSNNSLNGLTNVTTIKVPKSKLAAYKKLFAKKGLSSKVKVAGY